MKKVSIITLQYINNYGSVLQTLATQYIFEVNGCSSEIVNYTRTNCRYQALLENTKSKYVSRKGIFGNPLVVGFLLSRWKKDYQKKARLFDAFRKKYIRLSEEYKNQTELLANPPKADIYCTGSDQVWNGQYNGGVLEEYYLAYAPEGARKIALSASFGRDDLTDSECVELKELILQYKAISVREHSALNILDRIGYANGMHLLDPTLLLSKQEWSNIIQMKKVVNRRYVLFYQLNNNRQMEAFAKQIAKETDCKLVTISSSYRARCLGGSLKRYPEVEEFLSLINYAEYVVTDSFHGTAFSLNFNKQVYVFYPGKYSTRLQSILALVGAENRVVLNDNMCWRDILPIDYTRVNVVLEEERRKAQKFISEAISND